MTLKATKLKSILVSLGRIIMKNFVFVLAIILLLLPASAKVVVLDLSSEDLEAYGVAGAMAMLSTSIQVPDPKPEKCECDKNTGKISYDGGTSITNCPCENSECGCKKPSASVSVEADKFPRIVLVTQVKSCIPCRKVEAGIVNILKNEAHQKSGWKVGRGSGNNLQVLDLDNSDSIKEIDRLKIEFLKIPSFFKITKDGVINGPVGDISYDRFIEFSDSKKK